MTPDVRVIGFTPTSRADAERGLLGFVRLQWGTLELDSLALRRTQAGKLALSFPCRSDARGRKHAYYKPVSDAARQAIEEEVFKQLGLPEVA